MATRTGIVVAPMQVVDAASEQLDSAALRFKHRCHSVGRPASSELISTCTAAVVTLQDNRCHLVESRRSGRRWLQNRTLCGAYYVGSRFNWLGPASSLAQMHGQPPGLGTRFVMLGTCTPTQRCPCPRSPSSTGAAIARWAQRGVACSSPGEGRSPRALRA